MLKGFVYWVTDLSPSLASGIAWQYQVAAARKSSQFQRFLYRGSRDR